MDEKKRKILIVAIAAIAIAAIASVPLSQLLQPAGSPFYVDILTDYGEDNPYYVGDSLENIRIAFMPVYGLPPVDRLKLNIKLTDPAGHTNAYTSGWVDPSINIIYPIPVVLTADIGLTFIQAGDWHFTWTLYWEYVNSDTTYRMDAGRNYLIRVLQPQPHGTITSYDKPDTIYLNTEFVIRATFKNTGNAGGSFNEKLKLYYYNPGSNQPQTVYTKTYYNMYLSAGNTRTDAWVVTLNNIPSYVSNIRMEISIIYNGETHDSKTASINIGNKKPVAQFTYTPTSPKENEPVYFDATSSYDPDGSVTSYSWNFGDGTTGSGSTTTHTYSQHGTYTVKLTVTDNKGATTTTSKTITIAQAKPPVAIIELSDETPEVGQDITFDASNSYDPDGYIKSYYWNISINGKYEENNKKTFTAAFIESGTATIRLTVTDNNGLTDTAVKTITVGGEPTVTISANIWVITATTITALGILAISRWLVKP